MWEWILIIGLLVLWLGGIPLVIASERKQWNNGKCTKCGHEYRHFDTDSQGGRGYICDKCNNVVWISWGVDKKKGK